MVLILLVNETSVATISNALYELALNHIIQNRLREEIRSLFAKNNGELTFEDVMTMPYLDAVFKGNKIYSFIADIFKTKTKIFIIFR